MPSAHPSNATFVVLCLAMASVAGTIKSIRMDSVLQTTIQKQYRFTGAASFRQISIEPATYDDPDSAIPSPSLRYTGAGTAISFGTCLSMSEKLFDSMDSLYDCCMRDRLTTPYKITLSEDAYSIEYEYLDGGCPTDRLEGANTMYCHVSPAKYRLERPWAIGDSIVYANEADTVVVIHAMAPSSIHRGAAVDLAAVRISNRAISRVSQEGSWSRIDLYDVHGDLVRRFEVPGKQAVSIAELDAGLYLCRVRSSSGATKDYRFIKTE